MELERIEMDGKSYPIKLNIRILEEIQEKYGSIVAFEKSLLPVREKRDENGNIETNEKGVIYEKKEPSIKTINDIFPKMIQEGLKATGETWENEEPIQEIWLQKIEIPYIILAVIIRGELKKCYEVTKKFNPKTGKKKRSLSTFFGLFLRGKR